VWFAHPRDLTRYPIDHDLGGTPTVLLEIKGELSGLAIVSYRDRAMKLTYLLTATTLLSLPSAADAGCPIPGFKYAAFGDNSLDINGGAGIDSYDSSAGTFADTHVSSGGNLGTNGTGSAVVKVQGNSDVYGNVDVGFGGDPTTGVSSCGGCTVQSTGSLGSAVTLSTVSIPSLSNASPFAPSSGVLAPNKTYGAISCNGNKHLTVNAGTYVMSGLDLNGQCDLIVASGPVEIYITGTAMHLNGGSVTNSSLKSTDLVFYSNSLTDIELNGGTAAAFAVYSPKAAVKINGNADIYGSIVGKSFEINGGATVHYDKALGNLNTSGLSCSASEISRATPIVATISNTPSVVQGSFELGVGTAKQITSTASVASFEFPFVKGHMRARAASSISTTADVFSAGTVVFDAANGIPTVNTSGCATNSKGAFTSSCRNVFTNVNTAPSDGATFHPTTLTFQDSNADTIGALIAPTSAVPGIGSSHWQTIVRRVLAGTSNGTVAKLGGVDRSTVAVIGTSTVAGVDTRPTMAYFGGLDGMLHAVCASSGGTTASASNICPSALGTELWAFVPRVQLPLIRMNKARIDGSVRVVDVFGDFTTTTGSGTKSWHTVLTFQTGYSDSTTKPAVYALDVTDPAKPVLLWEYVTPATPSSDGYDLGTGLAMHAGPTLVSGTMKNMAIAQTNNGGSGGNGVVVTALSLELGTPVWSTKHFGFTYPTPPRSVTADNFLPSTGVPGGAVGVDLFGGGYTTDVVFGDLYGDLWRLKADTGTSATGSSTSPVFSFSTNKHPFGALPTILDNGQKIAVLGSGAYADPGANTPWTTSSQSVIGVKLTTTTQIDETSSALAINKSLTSGEKVAGQILVVGNQLFLLTDNSDINAGTYGTTGASTGHAYSLDFTNSNASLVAIGAGTQGGASGLANNGTALYGGSSDKAQQLTSSATSTTGTSVDYVDNKKATRLVWLRSQI